MTETAARFLFPAAELGAATGFYRQHGFVALSGVFSPEDLRMAHALWDEIADRRAEAGKGAHKTILLPHEAFPDVLKLIRHPGLLAAVRAMLAAEEIQLLQSQLMHGSPGTAGFSPHQDNFYNQVEPVEAVCAAWIAIEDVDEHNGALQVWPGSHRLGLIKVRRDWLFLLKRAPDVLRSLVRVFVPAVSREENDSGVMERFVHAQVGGESEKIVARVPAGAVIFMHGDMVHASGPNRTADRFRRSLLTNFIRRGAAFNQGLLTGRKPLDV